MSGEREYPARPFLAASIAVFREGRVLLARRVRAPAPGAFSLPGGLVETGETLAEAAMRELHEEVDIRAVIVGALSPLQVIDRDADGRVRHHFVVHPHAGRWQDGEPRTSAEATEILWATLEEARALPSTPGLDRVLAEAFALMAAA